MSQWQTDLNTDTKPVNTRLKLLAIGDLNTGKTSILRRYVYKTYEATEPTIGMDIATKYVKVQHIKWSIQFWDIAGQERFIGLTRTYYKHALAAIVVFDITQKLSLQNAKKWKNDVDAKVFLPNGNPIPAVLFANKWDLIEQQPSLRKFNDNELDEFCKENNFLGWFSTSAKTGKNIKKAMQFIIGETVTYVLNSEHKNNLPLHSIDISQKLSGQNNDNRPSTCSNCTPKSISSNDTTY